MADSEKTEEDQEVTRIALQVADAKDAEIPGLLAKLKNLMEKHLENSDELKLFKRTVWKYDLLSWCVIALRFDFTQIREGYDAAVSIVHLLCKCSCTLKIDDFQEFSKASLPDAINSIMRLLRLFQRRIADLPKKPSSSLRTDQTLVEELIDDLKTFMAVYRHLCVTVLNSSDLLRIIMEGEKLTPHAISLVQTALLVDRFCLPHINRGHLCALLDELVYILTVSSNPEVAASTTRLLVSMCDSFDDVVTIMVNRFKGLRAILRKWRDQGFNRDLSRLVLFLQTGSMKKAALARQTQAVRTIWAFYTGWKTRKRINSMRRGIPALQRSFRNKKREKEETAELEKSVRMQETASKMEKQRSFRHTREKQLHSLEIVPASKIPDFIKSEEYKAATTIQAHWRAHAERKIFNAKKEFRRQVNAVVIIQRATRKFLQRRKPRPSTRVMSLGAMEDHERLKYQQEITRWQTLNMRGGITHEQAKSVQEEAQKSLLQYYRTKYVPAREEHKLSALLARINTEQETLNHLPAMSEIDAESIDRLASNSLVIQHAATLEHSNEMKKLTSAWWKRLVVDDDEDELSKDGW